MRKDKIKAIIETTLTSGSKMPSLLDLPKVMSVKSKLEGCQSIPEVLSVLEDHRSLITKSFGIHDQVLNESMTKIRALETQH